MFGQNWWYKKEKPFFTGVAAGFGGFGFGHPMPISGSEPPYIPTTGGNIRSGYDFPLPAGPHGPAGDYTFSVFSASGTLTVPKPGRLLCAVLGGGGAGGWTNDGLGGGGGAGGLSLANIFIEAGTYTVTVGGNGTAPNNRTSNNGGNSYFAQHTAFEINGYGGGRGGTGPRHGRTTGANGGCGGGGHLSEPSNGGSAEQPTAPYGASITLNGGSIARYGHASTGTSPYAGGGTAAQNEQTDGEVIPWAPYTVSQYSCGTPTTGRGSPTNDRYGAGGSGGGDTTPYAGLGGGGFNLGGGQPALPGGTGSGGSGAHSNTGASGGPGMMIFASPKDGAGMGPF